MKNELSKDDILDALKSIPPSELDYTEWVEVGMALKDGGFDCEVWDNWSKADERYHPRDCFSRWDRFESKGVTVGTIVHMAQSYGWTKFRKSEIEFKTFDWDSIIQDDGFDFEEEKEWDGVKDLITYLETLFKPDEYVSYVTQTFKADNGRFIPNNKGIYSRTAKQLIESLKSSPKDITDTIGTYDPNAGAWIRFNPVDGKGVNNENVTRFTYALVESDTLPIQEQDAIYRKFQLPIALMVHSGGKSLHAIVKVEAKDLEEYRKRVEYLYDFFEKKGIEIDRQNRNPSRLSRLAGVMRNDKRQYIVDKNIGRKSWNDWIDFVEGEEDELPPFITFNTIKKDDIKMPSEIISGVLRKGHKMLISGDSKAGKSWLMMELAIAVSEGKPWLGKETKQNKVLYVNLEIDGMSCLNRFQTIYEELERFGEYNNKDNLYIWNLRGKAVAIDQLVPKIVRRIKDEQFGMIIIDPIYKIQKAGSDENAAGDIAEFCNQFDKLATDTGASIVYCHHHSKGSQGAKKMMDRASGSGVFARDPDAILDLIELEIDDIARQDRNEYATAWQLEFSLREFSNPKPIKMWFEYPLHKMPIYNELDKYYPEGSPEANDWLKHGHERLVERGISSYMQRNGTCDLKAVLRHTQLDRSEVENIIKKLGKYEIKGDLITLNEQQEK